MVAAVQRGNERIGVGVGMVANALRKEGRVIFGGAGTSGRLGILESAEMPPTFSTDPELVQAIMAGGHKAIFNAKEGVEDNYEEGAPARQGERDSYQRPILEARIKSAEVYRTDDRGATGRKVSEANGFLSGHSGTYGWVVGRLRGDPEAGKAD